MTVLITALLPVSLIILIGFIAAHYLSLEQKTLSQLFVYILSPALLVSSLYRTQLSTQSIAGLLGGFAMISVILYGVAWALGKILNLKPDIRKSLIATTLLPNTGNLGLSLNAFVYGETGLERAIVCLIGASILMFAITPALLRGGGLNAGVKLTLKLPIFWAAIAGFALRLLAIKVPENIYLTVNQLGMASISLGLLILGKQLAVTSPKIGFYEIAASSLRLLLAPLVAYGVGRALHLQGLDLQVLILQSSMPVAVSSLIMVTEFGGNPALVARTVVVSTLLSFLTLPLVINLSANF